MCVMTREIFDCLKVEQDICVKTIMRKQNMAFKFTPTLKDTVVIKIKTIFLDAGQVGV